MKASALGSSRLVALSLGTGVQQEASFNTFYTQSTRLPDQDTSKLLLRLLLVLSSPNPGAGYDQGVGVLVS